MDQHDPTEPRSLGQSSDAELVRLLVAGNQDAMGVVFDRYYRMVMSVALRIVHDVSEAEDVVQVVFTDFYRKAELFDERKGSLRTWLLQYAYGRSINQKNRLISRSFYSQTGLDQLEVLEQGGTNQRVFDLNTQDALRLVEQILPKLTKSQRAVIEMVFFRGMKLSEVASETGESLGNVQHAYYRGIDKLRSYLLETKKKPRTGDETKGRFSFFKKTRKSMRTLEGEVEIG